MIEVLIILIIIFFIFVYLKLENNLNGTLKLLQKELRDILEENTLEVSQSIKCSIKSIDKKNFQVICLLNDSSE